MTDHHPPLQPCEQLLQDPDELFLRQCSPRYLAADGLPSAQMFERSSAERHPVTGGKLSGSRSSKRSAEEAYLDRQATAPGSTVGTWGVEVRSVERLGSRCVEDWACDNEQPMHHTYLDLRWIHSGRSVDKQARSQIRQDLWSEAVRRGCLYRP